MLGLLAGQTRADRARLRADADPGAPADGDGDGRRVARRAVRRALPARPRRVGPQVSEGWYGVPFERPVRRTREYVEIVRAALARKTVALRRARVDAAAARRRTGSAAAEAAGRPVQERVPIYLGAVGPQGGRAGGRDRRRLAAVHARPGASRRRCSSRSSAGSAKAGRTRADIDVAPCVPMAVDDGRRTQRATRCARGSRSTSARWARKEKNFYVELADARRPRRRRARGARRRASPATATRAAAALTAELIDAMALATTPAGLDDRAGRVRGRRGGHAGRRAVRRATAARGARCARWRRPHAVSAARARRASPGSALARARGRSASTPPRCAARLREFARVQVFGEVFGFKAGRAKVWFELRDGAGALPCSMWRKDWDALGLAAARRRRAGRRRRRLRLLPRLAHLVAVVLVRGDRRAHRRRGRPAGPARAAAPRAARRGPVRAAEAAAAARAAAHDRRRHRRGRQGARRRARRAAPPRLGRPRRVGVRAGAGPPRRARDHARAAGPRGLRGGRGDRSSPAAAARWRTCSRSATRRCAAPSRCCACR